MQSDFSVETFNQLFADHAYSFWSRGNHKIGADHHLAHKILGTTEFIDHLTQYQSSKLQHILTHHRAINLSECLEAIDMGCSHCPAICSEQGSHLLIDQLCGGQVGDRMRLITTASIIELDLND